ncbi:hypothetical protein PGTUg99_036849 [Puccinia graminis f. sp. tritici]|uniref:Transmembrane protein n=1 Tax=Puccinia graminis f. sp. tritici TaxID=56615 RepID=A0A5B0SMN4_PUCGR|nr:hypothetical protein PGTUg99_036849 [Puccinia graminis f. sp. tritici]
MSTQITRRRSGSHFAQLIIIACILCASSINATPLPIASPSLGLSSQNSYLQPVSHLSKRMEIAGVAGAIATGQAVHNAAAAREGAAGKHPPFISAVSVDLFTPNTPVVPRSQKHVN